jgi:8-oxo-dGTP pyrophosphatase MutT (NUDIX family)
MEDSYHLGIKALLRDDEGRVLLRVNPAQLGDKGDYWDLPGGRVQKGQTVAETLAREVAEETGINGVTATSEVGMVLSNIRIPVSDDSFGLVLNIYSCNLAEGQNIRLSDEHITYDWFEPAKAAELLKVKYPDSFCSLVASLA